MPETDRAETRPGRGVSVRGPAPSALLDQKGDRLLGFLAQGYTVTEACKLADLPYQTVRHWLLRGGDPEATSAMVAPDEYAREPYRTFAFRFREALREGKKRDVPRPPKGRTPKALTEDQQAALCHRLAQGWTYHAACHDAGVTLSTFLSWLRLGGYPRPLAFRHPIDPAYIAEPYAGFVRRVLQAEADAFDHDLVGAA